MHKEFRLFPEQASSIASRVDMVYLFLVLISAFFTILIAGTILWFAIKYRRGSKADRSRRPSHPVVLETIWILGPSALTLVMFFWGADVFLLQMNAPPGATEINGVARQWMWKFQHPEGNAEINDLHVPINVPIKVNLISEDVIHSLYIPDFRVKHDVLPGRYTSVWFIPIKPGRYHLFCAEYCGTKHSEMGGFVYALEQSQYEAWLAGTAASGTPAAQSLLDQFRCNNCHRGGGETSRGPPLENLLNAKVQLMSGQSIIADESYIRESILRPAAKVVAGYQPIMPSYEGQVGEEGILKLIAEIKAMSHTDQRSSKDLPKPDNSRRDVDPERRTGPPQP